MIKMWSDLETEIERRDDGERGTEQVGVVEIADVGDVSACHHAQTDAYVPRGEVGRGGCAALAVGSQVDKERVEGGEHGAEPDAQEQGDTEEEVAGCRCRPGVEVLAGCQQEEADDDHTVACRDDLGDFSSVDHPSGEQSGDGDAHRHEGEEEACLDIQPDFLRIHGDIVGRHAVGDGQQQQGESRRHALQEDEAVEGDGLTTDGCLVGCLHQSCHDEPQRGGQQRTGEDEGERGAGIVGEKSCHRSRRHGKVVCQPVVTQSLATSRRRHDVDDDGVSADAYHAERQSVDDTEDDEQREGACHDVAGKHAGEHEIGEQVEGLAGESVDEIARERTDAERCHRVGSQDDADARLVDTEDLLEVEGKHGHQEPESEKQQEVGCQDEIVAGSE